VILGMRVALYARVSTKDKGQDIENQLHQLRTFAEQHGTIYKVYTDQYKPGQPGRRFLEETALSADQKQLFAHGNWERLTQSANRSKGR
jgi:hypothetical protein